MAADLEDRARLAARTDFVDRVKGAVLVTANTVGGEASGSNVQRSTKRTDLVRMVLADPNGWAARFTQAAAGSTLANTFADTAGSDDVKVAAITDTAIATYVTAAWDTLAGVLPVERGA